MSAIDSRVRTWLIWTMPFVVIALLIGWETEWGSALTRVPPLDATVVPQPVNVALLPEYKVDGGVAGNRETVDRTLFNPTRRPAPPTTAAAGKSSMQKGQFVLTGTTVADARATAFLREVNGGKSRRVQQGETINGMYVSEVRADRVRLTMNGETEELSLKVAAGPKTTVQPAVAPPQPQPGQPGGPVPAAPAARPQQPARAGAQPAQDVADVLANRRRAARVGEAAAAGTQAAPAQVPAAAGGAQQKSDPGWNEVYQRYMQPRGK